MELSREQEQEILAAVKKYQPEATNKLIYKDCKSFDGQTDFGLAMRQMINLGLIYKKEDFLFVIDLTGESKPKATKDLGSSDYYSTLAKTPVAVNSTARHTVNFGERRQAPIVEYSETASNKQAATVAAQLKEEKKVEKTTVAPKGKLRRSAARGGIALACYLCRNERPLTRADILSFLKTSPGNNLATHIKFLCGEGLIEQDHKLYRWSGKFSYPYPEVLSDDYDVLTMTLKEWKAKESATVSEVIPPNGSVTNTDPEPINALTSTEEAPGSTTAHELTSGIKSEPKDVFTDVNRFTDALSLVKWQIKTAESKLESLKLIESMLENKIAEYNK